MLDKLFKLNERGTSVKTEILAGITTFYHDGVHPILRQHLRVLLGMDKDDRPHRYSFRWWPRNDCYGFIC